MTEDLKGRLEIEDRGAVLVVRVDGGPHQLFGRDIANSSMPWWTEPTPTRTSGPSC